MQINSISSLNFKEIYCGVNNEKLSRTQRDVISDVESVINEKGYSQKLKNIGYDVYLEPKDDGYAMEVALIKNVKNENGNITFDKIVKLGKYVADNAVKRFLSDKLTDTYLIEQFENRLNLFLGKQKRNYYKNFSNIL